MPRKDSVYSLEGTAAHDVAEMCLLQGKDAKELCEDEETAEAIQVYLDEVRDWRQSVDEVIVEHTERTLESATIADFGGTSDHYMIYRQNGVIYLHCFDYKHGVGVPVDAENNLQVLSYFSTIESHYPGLIERFRCSIIQPRAFQGEKKQLWECGTDKVTEHTDNVSRVDPDNGPIKAGSWCRWCPAVTFCEELERETLRAAQTEFGEVRDNTEVLLRLRELAPAIKTLLDKVEDALVDKFRDGGDGVPGMKVVEVIGNRRWTASEGELTKLLEGMGVERKAFIKESFRTPAQVEKALDKVGKVKLADYTKRVPTGYKVVPESDKGTAYDFTLSDVFTEIE